MTTTLESPLAVLVTGGVDTHADAHVVAAFDQFGRDLGSESFPADPEGFEQLLGWLVSFGEIEAVGVEGTGSYGAGLNRFLHARGVTVFEINRPDRALRRRHGKSDAADARAAVRTVQSGQGLSIPKTADGRVEALRVLQIPRSSAVKQRTQVINQIRAVVCTAPDELRCELRRVSIRRLAKVVSAWAPVTNIDDPDSACRYAIIQLVARLRVLDSEIAELNKIIERLVRAVKPELLEPVGFGPATATAILVGVGDNPQRLATSNGFAALCGVSPVDASSGKTQHRHRLNRGGNRSLNSALYMIAIVRMRYHEPTKAYVARRTTEGKSKKEIIRCLKRYIAREIFQILAATP